MILVIEDDPGIQKVLHRLFISDGFQVRAAHDGKEAQEAMKGPAPEVVILDLMLPGASGKDLCKSSQAHVSECSGNCSKRGLGGQR